MKSNDILHSYKDDKAFNPDSKALVDEKYRIERLIGTGGMGSVYEATQVSIGRQVAIKILHSSYADDRSMIDRFHREANAVSAIGHDNICEVTDFGLIDDHVPYLVMPLLKGLSLADALDSQQFHIRRILDIIGQILTAVQAAHNAYIIHRDLKPENVFITQVGDRVDFVKLLDFGISRFTKPHGTVSSRLTDTGLVLGTAFYMAPEQAMGSRWIDQQVDIYAVGVILYEALTGRLPYVGETYNEIMHRIATQPFPAPRIVNSNIPEALEQIVLKSMQRDPAERYASADEMRRDLDAIETREFYLPQRHERIDHSGEVSRMDTISASTQADNSQSNGRGFSSTDHPSYQEKEAIGRSNKLLLAFSVVVVIAFVSIWAFFYFSRRPSPISQKPQKEKQAQRESSTVPQTKNVVRRPLSVPLDKKPAEDAAQPQEPRSTKPSIARSKRDVKERAARLRSSRVTPTVKRSFDQRVKPQVVSGEGTRNKTPKAVKGRFGTIIYSEYE